MIPSRFWVADVAAHVEFGIHAAAGHERIGLAKKVVFAIEDSRPGRAEHLVAGEGQEVTVEILHIGRDMGNRLGSVDDEKGSMFMDNLGDFLDGGDMSEDIGHVGDGHDLRRWGQSLLEVLNGQFPFFVEGNVADLGAGHFRNLEPRENVGGVLGLGEEDFVASFEVFHSVAESDEVERRGRTRSEDDFLGRGIDELGQLLPGVQDLLVHVVAEVVVASVGVAGFRLVVTHDGLFDRIGFERRRGVVEEDEGLTLHLHLVDVHRKVFSQYIWIKHGKVLL